MKTITYTMLALCAFAGNSILCRLALGDETIDAASFTSIRLLSGALALAMIIGLTQKQQALRPQGSCKGAIMLFVYAVTFSFAYISLETGTGALVLFSSVQITMILVGVLSGNKIHGVEWLGLATAIIGFVYLVLPDIATPSLQGFILMAISGIAWGFYTLIGKGSTNPLGDTAYNFLRTLPFIAVLALVATPFSDISQKGVLLAVMSGAIASGAGYTIWYIALKNLATIQAAVVQLLVPVLATLGGVLFVEEPLSLRLAISSLLILGGILIVILGKRHIEISAQKIS